MDVYLKEGNSDYASINPQNYRQYSLLSNWHHSSELLPYQSSPSWISHHGCWKAPFWHLVSLERTPLLKNTSITSQTPVGPLTQMVYFATSDASMSRTLAIFNYVFFNIHMIIPCRSFRSDETLHQVWMHYYWPRLPIYIKDYCNHVSPVPMPNPCATTLRTSQATSVPRSLGIPFPWIS